MTNTATWPPRWLPEPGPDLAAATRQRYADPTRHSYRRPIGESAGCATCGCDRSWHARTEGDDTGHGIAGLTAAEDAALREALR